MRRVLVIVFGVVVFGVALALVLTNLADVALNYLFGTVTLPLAAVLALALFLGVLLGGLAMFPALMRLRLRQRGLKSRLSRVERELDNLRRAPLQDAR